MASFKVRELQVRIDLDLDEIAVVRWKGLDRESLYVAKVADPRARGEIQALFDGAFQDPPFPSAV